LCQSCAEFLDYATNRLERCPYAQNKTTCAACRTHCYKLDMREKVRKIMRFSGPKMIWSHPILALLHFLKR